MRFKKNVGGMKLLSVLLVLSMVVCMWGCACGSGDKVTDGSVETTESDETGNNEDSSTTDNMSENDETDTSKVETDTSTSELATSDQSGEQATSKDNNEQSTTQNNNQNNEQATSNSNSSTTGTPYGDHGKLSVSGTKLVDKNGATYQLKGVSTHGISWFPQYVSYDTFKYLRDQWGANVVRIAMYTAEYNGYCSGGNQDELKALVKKGVDAATELGLYVVVDWHILSDSNPWNNKDAAVSFFKEISSYYKNSDNIIYEICNEPNGGTSWSDIKSYANEIIPVIRANDPDAIIVVGTPTWSQDVDTASWDKITGYDNIMYTLHYYAATHKQYLRDKAQTAINNGCALFVTEFSICDASGNGALDKTEANLWLEFLNNNDISFIGWNLANKDESSSLFLSSCSKICDFADSDLSEWAKWLREAIRQ